MILRLRAGYIYNTTIAIRSGRVTDDCPNFCLCCGKGEQSFIHWIFKCSTFSLCRCKFLDFIDNLFIIFANKVRNLSLLPSYFNILEYENFINRYIYTLLLGGISALDVLQFDTGEQRHLSEQLLKSSQGSTVLYIVGLAEYLANTIYQSSVALLSYFLSGLAKTLSLPRVLTSYRYGKGIVQLKVLLILINTHLLIVLFRIKNP